MLPSALDIVAAKILSTYQNISCASVTFWIPRWGKAECCKFPKLVFKAPILQKAFFLFARAVSFGPQSSKTTRHRAREQPMELQRGQFHNTHVVEEGEGGVGSSIVLRAPQSCGREPLLRLQRGNAPSSQVIFFSFSPPTPGGHRDRSIRLLAAAGPPAPLPSPIPPPLSHREGLSRRCTARKPAAATIITLIARFFCWAEISSGATILLLKL